MLPGHKNRVLFNFVTLSFRITLVIGWMLNLSNKCTESALERYLYSFS
jgi:hypothetical protein